MSTADGDERKGISGWWFLASFLLPIVGFIAGIVFLAKGKVGPGLALWGTALLGAIIGLALLSVTGGDAGQQTAQKARDSTDVGGAGTSETLWEGAGSSATMWTALPDSPMRFRQQREPTASWSSVARPDR